MHVRFLLLLLISLAAQSIFAESRDSSYTMINGERVYRRAQFKPEFPGGKDSLLAYIDRNLKLPNKKVGGTVTVSFIVSATGQVHSLVVMQEISGHPEYSAEAKRVILSMPLWKPAIHFGKNVSSFFMMPISFVVKSGKKSP